MSKNKLLIILLILLIVKFPFIAAVFVCTLLCIMFPVVDCNEPSTNYFAGYEEVLEKPFKQCTCGHKNFPDDNCAYRDLLYCRKCGVKLFKLS